MIVKEEVEFDTNDILTVKCRLNEQSKLIMLLKESADKEMMQAREYEIRLAQEEDKSFELQQEIEELRMRLTTSQTRIGTLSQTVDRLYRELHATKPVQFEAEVQCHFKLIKKQTFDKQLNTELDWRKELQEYFELKEKCEQFHAICQQVQAENAKLQDSLNKVQFSERENTMRFQQTVNKLRLEREQLQSELERLQHRSDLADEKWSRENARLQREVTNSKLNQEKLETAVQKLQQQNTAMNEELWKLNELRKTEQDQFNVDKQVRRLTNQLNEARDEYSKLQQEFNAYKRHAKDLLEAEKTLNRKLRQTFH
ncbi:hypothetical protein EG68_06093 [Paragonimus skrjabini miyazakii]|uniref:Uncharacterized protein n=1 Tax=Paragonimus skrjabini miyazakii TaxID=59628 RepID=A0A8S9Z898_9TREM|nr:hypothetical protein EG68_06093 [Paragonimus skrjabini miyazakii]